MCCGVLCALVLHVATAHCAPLRPHLETSRAVQHELQQQLLDLQHLQRNAVGQLSVRPVIILVANGQTADTKTNEQTKPDANTRYIDKQIVDEDLDSVIIEADPGDAEIKPQRLFLLPDYARLSIGDVISAIPFLPIEINVPDTIGWAYNGISSGISSIISIFGRLPFTSSPTYGPPAKMKLQSVLQQLGLRKRNNLSPLLVVPLEPQVVRVQLPLQG